MALPLSNAHTSVNMLAASLQCDNQCRPQVGVFQQYLHHSIACPNLQVLGVVLVPDEEGHLQYQHHPAKGEKPPPDSPVLFALPEEVGTCFCMQGQVRHWPYYHSVSAVAQKRVSLTIRTTHFHPPPPSADAPVPPLNTAGVTASGTGDHAEGGSPRDPPSPRPSPTTGLTGDEEIGCVCAIL